MISSLIQTITDILARYGWQVMATVLSPAIGYTVGQKFKLYYPHASGLRIANVASGATLIITTVCWWHGTNDPVGALILGVLYYLGWGLFISALFAVARRWMPNFYQMLRGPKGGGQRKDDDGNDLTTFSPYGDVPAVPEEKTVLLTKEEREAITNPGGKP